MATIEFLSRMSYTDIILFGSGRRNDISAGHRNNFTSGRGEGKGLIQSHLFPVHHSKIR